MKTGNTMLLVAIVLAMTVGGASALYTLGEFSHSLSTATHVVDATVTEITEERFARLDVHRHIKGTNAPTLLTGTALSCRSGPPGAYGMQAGRRYIIMLRDDALFAETTYFEVTKRDDGTLGCRLSDFHKRWLGASDNWVTLDELTRLITSQQKK